MTARLRHVRRGSVLLAAVATIGLTLAGCSAAPDLTVERAESVFDELVAELAAVDTETLRTVETAPAVRRACDSDPEREFVAFIATATPTVTVEDFQLDEVAQDLSNTLRAQKTESGDEPLWSPLVSDRTRYQFGLEREDGTRVIIETQDRILVLAVLTPCLSD